MLFFFFFSSRRRHTRCLSDWSSDVCSSDLVSRTTPALEALHKAEIDGVDRGFVMAVVEITACELAGADGSVRPKQEHIAQVDLPAAVAPAVADCDRVFKDRLDEGGERLVGNRIAMIDIAQSHRTAQRGPPLVTEPSGNRVAPAQRKVVVELRESVRRWVSEVERELIEGARPVVPDNVRGKDAMRTKLMADPDPH